MEDDNNNNNNNLREGSQNSNNSNNNEDLTNLFNNKDLIEGKKNRANKYDEFYPFGFQGKLIDKSNSELFGRVDIMTNIKEKAVFILEINNNEEKVKFVKIIYNKIEEITYEQFTTPSKQEKENIYDLKEYFILFENFYKK